MPLDLERVRGSLLCFAIGDALGRPLKEITVTRRLQFKYGKEAPKRLSYSSAPPAMVTDETQQMLFVADGIIRHLHYEQDRSLAVRRSLLNWRRSQGGPGLMHADGWLAREGRLYFRRLPERMVELALDDVDRGALPTRDAPINDSQGPTAMTRSVAYGVALHSAEAAFDSAFRDAAWTHGHPTAQLAAGTYASLLHALVRGATLAQALEATTEALNVVEGMEGPIGRVLDQARHIAAGGPPLPMHLEALGDGRDASSALAIGLSCAMTVEDPTAYGVVRALWRSVSHGGSSDTTGAITGGLLGAMLGPETIPHPWLIDLEMLEVLERVSKDLFAAATQREITERDYPA